MLPLAEALRLVDVHVKPLARPPDVLPVTSARGRCLATAQYSALNIPRFDKSAVDGYAIADGNGTNKFRLRGTVAAGQSCELVLAAGDTVKVLTGAQLPVGTRQVVMQEQATEQDGWVSLPQTGSATNICYCAEDLRQGDLVLPAGASLNAPAIANLVACGIHAVPVVPRLNVAVISTGDELVADISELHSAMIINSNGPLLVELAAEFGLSVVSSTTVKDDPAFLEEALRIGLNTADLVVLTGGVSVGARDFVAAALIALGCQIHFDRVAIKPGKPMTCATLADKVICALPGNPAAVFLTFHLFVLRAAARLCGFKLLLREISAPIAGPYRRANAARQEFRPARINHQGQIELLEFHGSGHLAALLHADGLAAIPQGTTELTAGDAVTLTLFQPEWVHA